MDAVGITVDLGRYKATVHYLSCGLWTGYHTHTNRQMPPSIKMKMCRTCRPTPEDALEISHDISWVSKEKPLKYGDAMSKRAKYSLDDKAESRIAQIHLYGGRTLRLVSGSDKDE